MDHESMIFFPAQLVSGVVNLRRVAAEKKSLSAHSNIPRGMIDKVADDAVPIRQVLKNLPVNAIKFIAAGMGVSNAQQERWFKTFIQAGNAIGCHDDHTDPGVCIGKKHVKLLQSSISCHSDLGHDALFSFDLPHRIAAIFSAISAMAASSLQPAAQAASSDDEQNTTAFKPSDWRVLIAEDTEINLQLARMLLSKKGYQIGVAENGLQALEVLTREHYDLVLMDCMMPVMDGFEATRLWRLQETAQTRPRIPIIALTASALDGERQRCLAAGMDDYLSKPFRAAAFLAIVEHWLRRPH